MPDFYFGCHREGGTLNPGVDPGCVRIAAPSLTQAIRRFRIGTLYPHTYSDKRVPTPVKGRRNEDCVVYLGSEPGGLIPVYDHDVVKARDHNHHSSHNYDPYPRPLALITPEPEGDELAGLEEARDLLPAVIQGALGGATSSETAVMHAGGEAVGALTTRQCADREVELRQKQAELELRKVALENQQRDLELQVQAMRAEITRRLEQIWVIELFLGSHEKVHVLRQGKPAPSNTQITVMQRVLCMDEEMLVADWISDADDALSGQTYEYRDDAWGFEVRSGRGGDEADLSAFDAWVQKPENLRTVLPTTKGIVAIRPRRYPRKDRDGTEHEADTYTYFLVRNGEQLYRLWVDVSIWPRMFLRNGETLAELEEKNAKRMMGGFTVLQGLLERSTLFHPLPCALSVFDHQHVTKWFRLVRDDEAPPALGDGTEMWRLTWAGYAGWIRSQIRQGCRVLWAPDYFGGEYDKLVNRLGGGGVYGRRYDWNLRWPERGELYVLDQDDRSFLYMPSKTVTVPDPVYVGTTDAPRQRRVRFLAEKDELVPVDYLSVNALKHLLRDRSQRDKYHGHIGTLRLWWSWAKRQRAETRPFVDLVMRTVGVSPNRTDVEARADRARIERLVRWWRTKTKTHRSLGQDEPKALRMIVKAFNAGQDYDEDPEAKLLASLTERSA